MVRTMRVSEVRNLPGGPMAGREGAGGFARSPGTPAGGRSMACLGGDCRVYRNVHSLFQVGKEVEEDAKV